MSGERISETGWVATCYGGCGVHPVAFADRGDRDRWAAEHARTTGHSVATPAAVERLVRR